MTKARNFPLPGPSEDNDDNSGIIYLFTGLMGQFVPHSIRGSIYSMDQFHPTTELFSNCTACSSSVIKCYGEDGFALMCKACNSPNYLEDLTGLSKLLSEANMDDLEIDFSGSEEDF